MKGIKELSFAQRGQEIERYRRAILRWARLKDNQKCHEEDDRLARTVGIKHVERSTITSTQMFRKCKKFINGQCRTGRIKGDLITIKV